MKVSYTFPTYRTGRSLWSTIAMGAEELEGIVKKEERSRHTEMEERNWNKC